MAVMPRIFANIDYEYGRPRSNVNFGVTVRWVEIFAKLCRAYASAKANFLQRSVQSHENGSGLNLSLTLRQASARFQPCSSVV